MAVKLFMDQFVQYITKHLRTPEKIFYFSDGSAAQYKNRTHIFNISCHEMEYNIEAEWNYFATSHGKNVSDGLGGTLKRLVKRASLQNKNVLINTPNAMYKWASENIKNMNFIFVSKDKYQTESIKINKVGDKLKSIPKTQSIHHIEPIDIGIIKAKYFSLSNEVCIHDLC